MTVAFGVRGAASVVLAAWLPLVVWTIVVAAPGARADDTSAAASLDDDYPRETLTASDGRKLALEEVRGDAATVIVCMSTECPISNEFLPSIMRLADEYGKRGVNFVGVDPNAGESLEAMAAYAAEKKLGFPFARDEGAKVSRQLLFSVTPEVRVFDRTGKIVYRGRVDDRYRAGGGQPGAKRTPDLALALDEVLAGKPVSHARTRPVGCPIQLGPPGGN